MTYTNLITANRKDLNAKTAHFEHRHFATIASIIREMPNDYNGRLLVAEEFAKRLRATSTRFQESRFLAACGVEG